MLIPGMMYNSFQVTSDTVKISDGHVIWMFKKKKHLFQDLNYIDYSALFLSDNTKPSGSTYYIPSDAGCTKKHMMQAGHPKSL